MRNNRLDAAIRQYGNGPKLPCADMKVHATVQDKGVAPQWRERDLSARRFGLMEKSMRILIGAAIALSVLLTLALSAPSEPLGNETINYRYDARGQLTNVSHNGSVNNNLQANYTYDKAGNRATVNVTGSPN